MRPFQLAIASAILFVACGCGGGSTPATTSTLRPTLASGNWDLLLLPQTNPPVPVTLAGSLMQQESSISGILHARASQCFDPVLDDLVVTGSVDGRTITLSTEPLRGQSITISATVMSANAQNIGNVSTLTGNYTFSGSACIGATGTVAALLIPPLTGTFTGSVTGSLTANVTADLTQTGPDAHGFFHLSGNFTFSGSPCFTSGTVVNSSLSGILADFAINTSDGGNTSVTGLNSLLGLAPNLGVNLDVQSGTCAGFFGQGFLAKQ